MDDMQTILDGCLKVMCFDKIVKQNKFCAKNKNAKIGTLFLKKKK